MLQEDMYSSGHYSDIDKFSVCTVREKSDVMKLPSGGINVHFADKNGIFTADLRV